MSLGKSVRVFLLLLILALVAFDAWITRIRTTDWDQPLRLTVYPIAGDGEESTRKYIERLKREDFVALEIFLQREAQAWQVPNTQPLRVTLGRQIGERPPLPPEDRSLLGTMWWSLKLRWWANRMESGQPRPHSQVRIFVLYYDPAVSPALAHSLGLQEGLIGVVHAFATRHMTQTNNVIIAHELLHTLGATDKYDPETGYPRYPQGFADPQREPLYPQAAAEIMGGRIPLSSERAAIPEGLRDAVVGPATALEIGWSGGWTESP